MKYLTTLLLFFLAISTSVADTHQNKSDSVTEEAKQAISEEQCE